jgi:DNA modification methylase
MEIKDRIKEFKRVRFSELSANPKNWRKHPDKQRDAMTGVLETVGWADAVLARETKDGLELIDGHLRKEIAEDAEVPVLILDVNQQEADLILATHDPLAAMAKTDQELLNDLVSRLEFDDAHTTKLLDSLSTIPTEIVEDKNEIEVPDKPKTNVGDLWLLDEHRLFCGDCTKQTPSEWKAAICVTDPPYGVGLNYATHDDNDIDNYQSLLDESIRVMKEIAPVTLLTIGHKHNNRFVHVHQPTGWLIWFDKMKQSPSGYAHLIKTELIYILGKVTNKFSWDILEIQSVRGDGLRELHPCPKPVELWAKLIEPQTKKGDIVFDPFLGSGTTLIAAEQLNRVCFGMEISPAYCDVIVKRWENLTGKKAKKEKQNG